MNHLTNHEQFIQFFIETGLLMHHYEMPCIEDFGFNKKHILMLIEYLKDHQEYIQGMEIFEGSKFQFTGDDLWFDANQNDTFKVINNFFDNLIKEENLYFNLHLFETPLTVLLNNAIIKIPKII